MKSKLEVVLLKSVDESTSSSSSCKDKYADYIETNSKISTISVNSVQLVNILEFNFINLEQFKYKLIDFFNHRKYTCLVITSRQVIEAIKKIDLNIDFKNNNNKYGKLVVYCVGQQTSNSLKAYFLSKLNNNEDNDCNKETLLNEFIDIRVPLESTKQNATELANLIVNNHQVSDGDGGDNAFNALFPCSTIRKDDLIVKLKSFNLNLDELHVYETITSSNGLSQLNDYLSQTQKNLFINCWVFFSPSCVKSLFMQSIADNNHSQLPIHYSGNDNGFYNQSLNELLIKFFEKSNSKFNYFISFGPSTNVTLNEYLNKFQLNNQINVLQMSEPSPKSLLETLEFIYDKF